MLTFPPVMRFLFVPFLSISSSSTTNCDNGRNTVQENPLSLQASSFKCCVLFSRPCPSFLSISLGHISPTDEATPRGRNTSQPNAVSEALPCTMTRKISPLDNVYASGSRYSHADNGTYSGVSWNNIGFVAALSASLGFISHAPLPPRSLDSSQLGSGGTRLRSHCCVTEIERHRHCSVERSFHFHFQAETSGPRARGSVDSSVFRLSSAHRRSCLNGKLRTIFAQI